MSKSTNIYDRQFAKLRDELARLSATGRVSAPNRAAFAEVAWLSAQWRAGRINRQSKDYFARGSSNKE
jgi:hypothetical protein